MTPEEFREDIENFAEKKLSELDSRIDGVEKEITGIDFAEKLFHFEKRISKLEMNKFGYSLSTHNNGDN